MSKEGGNDAEEMQQNLQILTHATSSTPIMQGVSPVGLSPRPFPTSPLFLRSICQLSVSPALFFNVKANTAFPCLTASLRSASDAVRASFMVSKASEEGNAAAIHQ